MVLLYLIGIMLVILVAEPRHMFCVNSLSYKHLFESFWNEFAVIWQWRLKLLAKIILLQFHVAAAHLCVWFVNILGQWVVNYIYCLYSVRYSFLVFARQESSFFLVVFFFFTLLILWFRDLNKPQTQSIKLQVVLQMNNNLQKGFFAHSIRLKEVLGFWL